MKKKLINSQLCNMQTYLMYRRQMITLAENVFEFTNLPEFIDEAYLNKTLLNQGSIAWFYDEEIKSVIALPYSVIGRLDIYNRPQQIMARAFNGRYYRRLNKDEFIIMYDNTSMYSIILDICQMAERISLSKRTIDINIVQQRTPRIFKTSKDKEKSMRDAINQIDGLTENIVTYETLNLDEANVILAPAPFVADKIDIHLEKEFAEFYRLIGIANLQEQKRERVIVDEMIASQGGTIASRYSRFKPRKKAVKLINEKWGLKMEVRYYDGEPESKEEKQEREVVNDETETV